jgi:hypothetical protein
LKKQVNHPKGSNRQRATAKKTLPFGEERKKKKEKRERKKGKICYPRFEGRVFVF